MFTAFIFCKIIVLINSNKINIKNHFNFIALISKYHVLI